MTFEQFTEKVFEVVRYDLRSMVKNNSPFRYPLIIQKSVETLDDIDASTRLVGEQICTGGVHGGSCWDEGDCHHDSYSTGDSPDLKSLDTLLSKICPNITFLQYKRLLVDTGVQTENKTENEYYGNSSNYAQQYVTLGNLYEALINLDILK